MKEKTFKFGDNWKEYSKKLNKEMYLRARGSVRDIAGDMNEKTFLDIGCGSGVFSIAASGLGARNVVGIDVDPLSVETSKNNIETVSAWDASVDKNAVFFKKRSILDDCSDLGKFDIVYSWGVLHHTGDMPKALNNASKRVRPGGKLIISIYNRHFTSKFWRKMKEIYNKGPAPVKTVLFFAAYIIKWAGVCITQRRNPFQKERGMIFYFDVRDWIGGYPYEYASVEEIISFFAKLDFRISETRATKGFTGCNEFVFVKERQCAE